MSENIIQIRPVKREAAKLVIGLAGTSGEGKTYSALLLALGLAGGDPSKVGLLDTENRRGSLYADIFSEPFMIADLVPPHSPSRYIQAMKQFAASGIEALVVDSMSHEHEGEGGLEEIANAPKANGQPRKVADWLTAKREHKRFMNTLLHLPCHVIACFRARDKTDFKNPNEPKPMGLQPITEKNVLFEMTASFMVKSEGKNRDVIKLPKPLIPILGGQGYLTEEHGKQLREWVGGANPEERAKNELRLAAGDGMDALRNAYLALDKATQKKLSEFKDTLKQTAEEADRERAQREAADKGAPEQEEEKW